MIRFVKKAIIVLSIGVYSLMMTSGVFAEEWPFTGGDYWEVTGISIKDGGDLKYSKWLADEWRKNAEFAKSQGWTKDYMVLANVHPRSGEPDIYLITISENLASGPEGEERQKAYMDWRKKSLEQMEGENGNRAEYRVVMGTSLLQGLSFRE